MSSTSLDTPSTEASSGGDCHTCVNELHMAIGGFTALRNANGGFRRDSSYCSLTGIRDNPKLRNSLALAPLASSQSTAMRNPGRSAAHKKQKGETDTSRFDVNGQS